MDNCGAFILGVDEMQERYLRTKKFQHQQYVMLVTWTYSGHWCNSLVLVDIKVCLLPRQDACHADGEIRAANSLYIIIVADIVIIVLGALVDARLAQLAKRIFGDSSQYCGIYTSPEEGLATRT